MECAGGAPRLWHVRYAPKNRVRDPSLERGRTTRCAAPAQRFIVVSTDHLYYHEAGESYVIQQDVSINTFAKKGGRARQLTNAQQ